MAYRYDPQKFLIAIPGSGGILAEIARRVGCDWNTARKYVKEIPELAQAYEDEIETILDLAESKMIEAITAGDGVMIRFYLSTKGRSRGYVESKEISVKPIKITNTIIVRDLLPDVPSPLLIEAPKEEEVLELSGPLAEVITQYREMQSDGESD